MNSRAKGKRGELELAAFLREHKIEARRGVQFHGGSDSPDVVTALGDIHIECKRVEQGNPYDWLAQAIRDADGLKVPLVAHRRNGQGWIGIMRLDDLLHILLNRRDA